MNYSILSHFQWICVDANILETMPMKMEEKGRFGTCGQGLTVFTLPGRPEHEEEEAAS